MASLSLLGTAALFGIASHLSLFSHGEWEQRVPYLLLIYFSIEATLLIYLAMVIEAPAASLWTSFTIVNIGYHCGLLGSMGIYRTLFHRLRTFPGPFGARLSVFWSAFMSLPDYQFPKTVQELHHKYGDFVRIRPREISICNADAVADIHGPSSTCLKGPFYDINVPSRSLQMTRDKRFHSQRRRIWDRGFTTSALSEYEPRVTEHCLKLIDQLSARVGEPVNISAWLNYFGFDVMGDLAFGKSFNMIETAGNHFILSLMAELRPIIGFMQCVPWLFIIFQRMPVISKKRVGWLAWCAEQYRERSKLGHSRNDLFSYVLGHKIDSAKMVDVSEGDLVFDSELAIVAGSDTTSTTLAAILFLLSCHPEKLRLLQEELDGLFPLNEPVTHQKLMRDALLLQGCINEALRLYPAVPSGLQRVTPGAGVKIAGRWIPGDTIVSTPTFALHRDERYFPLATKFIPERWSTQPELVTNKNAFNPFLVGSYSCVGKSLALMEMRLLVYYIVKQFSFGFIPGSHRNEGEAVGLFDSAQGFKDFFTAQAPDFHLVFERRG